MVSLHRFKIIIVFDCETTGLNPDINHIIELSACKFSLIHGEYASVNQYDQLINIGYSLPQEIVELTGIKNHLLETKGREEAIVAEEFQRYLIENGDVLLVAYNAHFDVRFLSSLLSRHGHKLPSNISFLDALTVFKDRARFPHKLENAILHYNLGLVVQNSHRAIDDVKATFEVLKCMGGEKDDLDMYINLFGYNPKYPILNKIEGIMYRPQYYHSKTKIYE